MSPAHFQRCASGQVAAGTHTLCNEPHGASMREPARARIKSHESLFGTYERLARFNRWKASKFGCKIGVSALKDGASTLENSSGRD